MKNAIKLLGIVALAAAIVFSMVACPDGNDGGGGTGGGGGGDYSRLTITGLPQRHWSVMVFAAGSDLSSYMAMADAMEEGSAQAKGGSGAGSSYNSFTLMEWSNVNPWRGSGNREVYLLDSDNIGTAYYATVNFSNGNATVSYSIFRVSALY